METLPNYDQLRVLREIDEGPLHELLKTWLNEVVAGMGSVKDDVALRWKQGQIQALEHVLAHIRHSKSRLESVYRTMRQTNEMRMTGGSGSRFVE